MPRRTSTRPRPQPHRRPRVAAAALVTLALGVLSACGAADAAQTEDGATILRYQGSNDTVTLPELAQALGFFDGKVKLKWVGNTISGPQDNEHNMRYEIEEFVNLIQSGKRESSINTHELALSVAEIMEKARSQFGLIYPADRIQ